MNNSNISTGNNATYTEDFAIQLAMYLNQLGIPIIVVIGLLGNTVSFLVFVQTELRYKSSSIYLAFMNIADSGMLVFLIPVWLEWIHVYVFHQNGYCQIIIYFTYVFGFLSIWVVVSFTVERFIVVFYPLLRNSICTSRKALSIMIGLAALALVWYSYALWTTNVHVINGFYQCAAKENFRSALLVLAGVDTVVTLVVPSCTLIILNGSIMVKLFTYYRKQQDLGISSYTRTSDQPPSCETRNGFVRSKVCHHEIPIIKFSTDRCTDSQIIISTQCPSDSCQSQKMNKNRSSITQRLRCTRSGSTTFSRGRSMQIKTTRSLLIVSTIFLLLNLPIHAFRTSLFILQLLDYQPTISNTFRDVIQEICLFLYYINFSANFFLYVGSSTCFRDALWNMCRKKMSRTRGRDITHE